jgi:ribonuclease Z
LRVTGAASVRGLFVGLANGRLADHDELRRHLRVGHRRASLLNRPLFFLAALGAQMEIGMRISRCLAMLSACVAFTSGAWAQDFKVTLLGTGVPFPVPERLGPATLVEAGKEKLLFDAGRGATIRLNQISVPIGAINTLFITHFHSDHTSGIPDLWLTGWIGRYYGNRQSPFRIIGPKGTVALMQNLERAYADDIRIRLADEKNPIEGVAIAPFEYTEDGVVYENNGVKVTAFEVDHGDLIKPAYGYRVDYDGRSVIISGDTRYSANLEKHAQGATLVIHEVAIANQEYYDKTPIVKYIMAHHITPDEAGALFARLQPKLAAYTHLVFLGSPTYPAPKVADIERKTREKYSGPLALGIDLMAFDVRKDQVIVIPDASKK